MIKNSTFAVIFYFIILGFFSPILGTEINKSYPKKDSVQIKTIIGNCKIIESQDNNIHINVTYSFSDDIYKASFEVDENLLYLNETCSEYNPDKTPLWIIAIPENTKMMISSATGNITVIGVKTGLKAETGTGNIDVEKIIFSGNSRLSSGTGNVNVTIGSSSNFDISLVSGTGNVTLQYNNNPLKGCFVFSAKNNHGHIVSPIKFEKEEIIGDEPNKYDQKTFWINARNSPEIHLATGTGVSKLVE